MNPKPKRVVDEALLEVVRAAPCIVCGKWGPSDPHHIKTRGSGGDDTPENLVALCRRHHTEVHQVGPTKFLAKYPHLSIIKGWA